MTSPQSLVMERPGGRKVCKVTSAVIWSRARDSDPSGDDVVINIDASKPEEGGEEFDSSVDVILSWIDSPFSFDSLLDRTIEIPEAFSEEMDDHAVTFYYYEHLDMNKTVIRFIERDGDEYRVQVSGVVEDPCSDGSDMMDISIDTIVRLTER